MKEFHRIYTYRDACRRKFFFQTLKFRKYSDRPLTFRTTFKINEDFVTLEIST